MLHRLGLLDALRLLHIGTINRLLALLRKLLLLGLCLLYTSDAADDRISVDLGGRRIIKKKKKEWFQ